MTATIRTRFGEVEYDPRNTLRFVEGPIGFGELRDFLVMPNHGGGPFFWIQSTEDTAVAFLLTDPTGFFPDYRVAPDAGERRRLGLEDGDVCHVLAVVTVRPERQVSLNLAAPVLYAPEKGRALQVVLENSPYSTRQPLPGSE